MFLKALQILEGDSHDSINPLPPHHFSSSLSLSSLFFSLRKISIVDNVLTMLLIHSFFPRMSLDSVGIIVLSLKNF